MDPALKAALDAAFAPIGERLDAIERRQDDEETRSNRARDLGDARRLTGAGDANREQNRIGEQAQRGAGDDGASEYKALGQYARTGDDGGFKNEMSTDADTEGGYVTLPTVNQTIRDVARDQSPLFELARTVTLETGDAWVEPIEDDEQDWEAVDVGERESRPETDNAELGMDRYPLHEVYANVKVTQKLLDLSFLNVGQWVEGKLADRFGRKEAFNYALGDSPKTAKGFIRYPTSLDADFTRARGTWQHVKSGHATALTSDGLRDLYWAVRAPFRKNGTWLMASGSANLVDKLKDGTGAYLWRNSMTAGTPDTLLNRPVMFDENLPGVAAGTLPVWFGDWRRGYVIVERPGLRILRDPYTAKPHVMIYATKRSGGGGADFHALKAQFVSM